MKTITKDMLDICRPISFEQFTNDQESLAEFINQMLDRHRPSPKEHAPGFFIYVVIFIYNLLKTAIKIPNEPTNIGEFYVKSKGIFVKAMWYEEFIDEQPFLNSLMMHYIDSYLDENGPALLIDDLLRRYICILYMAMEEYKGRY